MQQGPLTWRRTAIVAAAVAAALIPLPPAAVDRWYSARLFATLQPLITSLSNLAPFALLDVLLGVLLAAWIMLAARDLRRSSRRADAALRVAVRTLVWCAVSYLVFLMVWGLNYRRPRLRETLAYTASAVTPGAAADAARRVVERLNALHDPAHANGWPPAGAIDAGLERAFARAAADAGIAREVVPARPKRTILDWYFRRAGVDGMTDPIFLETLIAGGVLPFEQPFVIAHEWSHLAGITDEGEANFTGWLACVRGSAPNAYSGWLFLYSELARVVSPGDRAALSATLTAGPRDDLRASRERSRREINPRLSAAGWRVYDSYLKANRVEAGAASYDEVVRLVLGVRLGGVPVWRAVTGS
jgi:hypothetical protein